jgi:hypothetical protein
MEPDELRYRVRRTDTGEFYHSGVSYAHQHWKKGVPPPMTKNSARSCIRHIVEARSDRWTLDHPKLENVEVIPYRLIVADYPIKATDFVQQKKAAFDPRTTISIADHKDCPTCHEPGCAGC